MTLKNKVAIVTGARRGIGKAIALELAKKGASVVVSDINLEEQKQVVEEIKELGQKALAIKADVTSREEVENMVQKTIDKFGRIDILVNNAGISGLKPFQDITEEDWDKVLDINLKGNFLCTKAVSKHMIKQESGKIISIASIAGKVGFRNASAYCASKAGIVNLTKELALELAPKNINVNAIAPGIIKTKMTEDMLEDENQKKALMQSIPLNRAGGPEEIGKAAAFLASNDADYITGHTLVIDGGWLAQ
ncbi:MAG TPA: 3-oxoacyl-ACP reductase family protein [Patescibacteria group bacterium]|nr:3-oxoacyl-ACP reductase family protein [Patescibacteria group bacterium]